MFSLKIVPQASLRHNRWTLRDLGGKVLREYLQTGEPAVWSVANDYVHRDGLVLAADTSAGQRHYHLDHLGTPRLITNGSGTKVAFHTYYPFGEEATAFSQDAERLKFTGHERDLGSPAGTGDDLDYMHARFHSPVTGRFLATDKHDILAMQFGDAEAREQFRQYVGAPQSWNRYTYTKGNPLKLVDTDGDAAVAAVALPLASGAGTAGAGASLAPAAPIILAGAAGVGAGLLINKIPVGGGQTVGSSISGLMVGVFFSTQAGDAKDFIATKVNTVFAHLQQYGAPNPDDPNEKSRKKGVGDRMRKHLEAARNKLKRLSGKTRAQYERAIERAEQELEQWIAGGG